MMFSYLSRFDNDLTIYVPISSYTINHHRVLPPCKIRNVANKQADYYPFHHARG